MNYDNYMELYEAVFIFSKINNYCKSAAPFLLNYKDIAESGVTLVDLNDYNTTLVIGDHAYEK